MTRWSANRSGGRAPARHVTAEGAAHLPSLVFLADVVQIGQNAIDQETRDGRVGDIQQDSFLHIEIPRAGHEPGDRGAAGEHTPHCSHIDGHDRHHQAHGEERRQFGGAFGRYMSPALVEQLAENPERLQLGGEMRDMTLLFCDVRGFTSISELYKSDPQGLTSLKYL